MNAQYLVSILPWIAVAAYVVYQQFSAQPIVERRLLVLPLIMAALGVSALVQQPPATIGAIAVLLVSAAGAVALGLWRGASVRVWTDASGVAWRKGTALTLALWLASFALRFGISYGGHALGLTGAVNFGELPLFLGITFAAQNAVIWLRMQERHGGAPVMSWSSQH